MAFGRLGKPSWLGIDAFCCSSRAEEFPDRSGCFPACRAWCAGKTRFNHERAILHFQAGNGVPVGPRTLIAMSSLGPNTVTFPMVGCSPLGRTAAVATCSEKAFEFAVENVAVPAVSVLEGPPCSSPSVAILELAEAGEPHGRVLEAYPRYLC